MTQSAEVLAGLGDSRARREDFCTHLHSHPQLSSHEVQTTADVSSRLGSFGYDLHAVGGGVVGDLANGPRPTVVVRADMDALPVTQLTKLPYASKATIVEDASVLDTGTEAVVVAVPSYLGKGEDSPHDDD